MELWLDVRHAARLLARRRSFTLVSVATLALGIGGATAIFSVADAVILRPLPFRDPERLVVLQESDLKRNHPTVEVSYPAFRAWRDESHSFESLAVMPSTLQGWVLSGRGEPMPIEGQWVSAGFFEMLGVRPALGRGFRPDDDRPGAPHVVVLGERLWRERFGADPGLIGQSLNLDRQPYTVVGVMPKGFEYPQRAQAWTPIGAAAGELLEQSGVWWALVVGRLKPGVSLGAARTEVDGIWARFHRPQFDPSGYAAVVTPLAEKLLGSTRLALLALLGAVGLVLLIACANVAGLLIVETLERRSELAVRQALGASRARLAWTLSTESLLLAGVGGTLGVLAAIWATPLLVALSPADVPRIHDAALNLRALGFALVASCLTAVLAGLAPVAVLRRSSLEASFRAGARTLAAGRNRLRSTLVVSEVALALVLLVGAGLLVRTFQNLAQVPLGFEPAQRLALEVSLPDTSYPEDQAWRGFYARILDAVDALPGVEAAAIVTLRPLWGPIGMDWPSTVEGQSKQEAERNPLLNMEAVSPGYFATMGIPVRAGRVFASTDTDSQPGVVVVSEGLARRYWPGQDAIGKRLKIPLPGTSYDNRWLNVVGVVSDVHYRELQATRLDLYMSYRQANQRPHHLIVKTRGEPAAALASIRDAVRRVDPEVPLTDVLTLSEAVSAALGGPRFAARLFGAFALVALLLAALGLYGLLAYSVSRRTREIGVRMALGARASQVRRLVLGEGLWLTGIGVAIGLTASLASARLLKTLLFGVATTDSITYLAGPILLTLVASLACLVPARRALRVDPAAALRSE